MGRYTRIGQFELQVFVRRALRLGKVQVCVQDSEAIPSVSWLPLVSDATFSTLGLVLLLSPVVPDLSYLGHRGVGRGVANG